MSKEKLMEIEEVIRKKGYETMEELASDICENPDVASELARRLADDFAVITELHEDGTFSFFIGFGESNLTDEGLGEILETLASFGTIIN